MIRAWLGLLLVHGWAFSALIPEVRKAIAADDFALAEKQIQAYQEQRGITPEMLEAHSWLARGALAAGKLEQALEYAAETRRMTLAELKKRPLDAERHLPIALGAAIEVHAQVLARQNARAEAIAFLRTELKRWHDTSIRTRIQKNIHLLGLHGQKPPRLETAKWLGPRPPEQDDWKGRPVLLFFWAHWCGDCKRQLPAIAAVQKEFGPRGLLVIAPTQRYGYVGRGEEAAPEAELRYIDEMRRTEYAILGEVAVPVSEENFRKFGASTTPTLVLLDREGKVSLYHPGTVSAEQLRARLEKLMSEEVRQTRR